MKSCHKVGTILFGPGTMLLNGLKIKKGEDKTISIDTVGKFNVLEVHAIDRIRCKQ